jgi:hypothetical protein
VNFRAFCTKAGLHQIPSDFLPMSGQTARKSTLFRMKAPISSKLRITQAPLGALELTGIGAKLNSRMGCKVRRPGFVPP